MKIVPSFLLTVSIFCVLFASFNSLKAIETSSSDARLKEITISEGTLYPDFNTNRFNYVVRLPKGTITAPEVSYTPNVEGVEITEIPAGNFTDSVSQKTTKIIVTALDNKTTREYSITFFINSVDENNKSLVYLSTNKGELDTTFIPSKFHYKVDLKDSLKAIPEVYYQTASESAITEVNHETKIESGDEKQYVKIIVFTADKNDSLIYQIDFRPPTSIENYIYHITVYPNPVHDIAYIKNIRLDNYEIYNQVGQLVYRSGKSLFTDKVDFSGLNTGIYIIKGETVKGKLITSKIIKR